MRTTKKASTTPTLATLSAQIAALRMELQLVADQINADHADNKPAPVCATHEVPCEAHWICPVCISENPELDACARELQNANTEIRDLRSQLAASRVREDLGY